MFSSYAQKNKTKREAGSVISTCNVDVLHDVKNIVVIDLSLPLCIQDVVNGAFELHLRSQFVHHLPVPQFSKLAII